MNSKRRAAIQKLGVGAAIALALPRLTIAQKSGSRAEVVFLDPAHADFAGHRTLFNRRIALIPASIAVCSAEAGVVAAVRHAKAQGLAIAIKSGGHSFEGFSINDGGMVI